MKLKLAQIVVTEGARDIVSGSIRFFTKSRVTHVVLNTATNVGVEAWFPKVREISMLQRLDELRANNRAFAVLDLPSLSAVQRKAIAQTARSYIGRRYDVAQVGLFALTGQFWNDGPKRLMCSRLITSAYESVGVDLFPDDLVRQNYGEASGRVTNLLAGYAAPVDLLRSRFEVQHFEPSTRVKRVEDFLLPP